MSTHKIKDPTQALHKELQALQDETTSIRKHNEQLKSQYTALDMLQQKDRKIFAALKTIFQHGDMHTSIEEVQTELRANEKKLYMYLEEAMDQGNRRIRSCEDRESELYLQYNQSVTGEEKQ